MELSDLVGPHVLSGVDRVTGPNPDFVVGAMYNYADEQCEWFTFVLDGVAYVAVEDPDDGYRSHCRDLATGDAGAVMNKFSPVSVTARMMPDSEGPYATTNDVLELVDDVTGMVVLAVGTSNTDDYYPCFVAEWHPENLAGNQEVAR